jgi:hypothetical protein
MRLTPYTPYVVTGDMRPHDSFRPSVAPTTISTECLHITRGVVPRIHDAVVWVTLENPLLTTYIPGDTIRFGHASVMIDAKSMPTTISEGPRVYRGLLDVMTDVLALGIHCESPEK